MTKCMTIEDWVDEVIDLADGKAVTAENGTATEYARAERDLDEAKSKLLAAIKRLRRRK